MSTTIKFHQYFYSRFGGLPILQLLPVTVNYEPKFDDKTERITSTSIYTIRFTFTISQDSCLYGTIFLCVAQVRIILFFYVYLHLIHILVGTFLSI